MEQNKYHIFLTLSESKHGNFDYSNVLLEEIEGLQNRKSKNLVRGKSERVERKFKGEISGFSYLKNLWRLLINYCDDLETD